MLFLTLAAICAITTAAANRGDAVLADDRPPGRKLLADDGSWGYNGPHAVISHGKLFCTYIDTEGMVWAASYDPQSGEIIRSPVWDTYADLHQASSLFVRPDGRIQVFVNKDGVYSDDEIFWKVSAKPGDIAEFGPLQQSKPSGIAQGRQFYPLVHESTGNVYLILNAAVGGNRRIGMWKSTDGGDTFDQYYLLYNLADDLRGNRSYTRAYIEGDSIHLVAVRVGWNEPVGEHNIGRIEGVYYTRYDINDEAFYHADGRRAFAREDGPVDDTRYFDELWNWEKDGHKRHRALWADIVAKDGRPYVAFVTQEAVPRGESALHDGYWASPNEKGQWQAHKVATLARGWDNKPERVNYAIAIDPQSPTTVFVSKSTDEGRDLSQVHRMATADGGATWVSQRVLSTEGRTSTVVVPYVMDKTPRTIDVLWLEGPMEGWRSYATKVMMARTEGAP